MSATRSNGSSTHASTRGSGPLTLPLTLSEKKERGTSSSSQENVNGSNCETPTEALRELRDEMLAEGFDDADDLLRLLAAKVGRRALDVFRCDPTKGRGWLRAVLRDGASMLREPGTPLSGLDRQRISSFDALYERSTGREWPA